MNLVPKPDVTISDAAVGEALGHAVHIINPLLDVLWETDPFQLKRRSGERDADGGAGNGVVDKVADAVAWALNAADVPGTPAWDARDADARIDWWVQRVGALNTVAVAFPGFFGVLARRLPVQEVLGFGNQAMVLCAVARELGLSDQRDQVRLLAAVLCRRELSDDELRGPVEEPAVQIARTPRGIGTALWNLLGLLNAIGDELAKRPQPRAPLRYLGMLPIVGAVAGYVGERGALIRAAKAGRRWIAAEARSS